jgi:hypothetical protein
VHVQLLPRRATRAARPLPPPSIGQWRSALRKAFTSANVASLAILVFAAFATATCSEHVSEPIEVSVRDVVTDPYAVDGKLVRLSGLLHRSPAGDVLYWHEQDIQRSNQNHAVAVRLSSSWPEGAERRGAYVAVEGVYEADYDEAGSDSNGAVLDARSAEVR